MTTETEIKSQPSDAKATKHFISGETAVGFAVLGCFIAGLIGLFKATEMEGIGAAACLLASVAAFGTICYIYFRKD